MKLSMIKHTAFMMIVVLLLTSCRDELCYDHFPSMDISLTWEYEWERDYGMHHSDNWESEFYGFGYDQLRPGKPEWVNMIRISEAGNRYEHFLDKDGEKVMMDDEGIESMLLYNGDTEYIILSDLVSPPHARASATGRSRSSLTYVSERHPSARTTNPPDHLYAAYVSDIQSIPKHEVRPMHVKMQPLVYTYVVRYEFEYGLDHVSLARGALGGMAESVYLFDGRTSEETAIVLYDCELKPYGCEAHVRTFGIPGFPDEYYGRSDTENPGRIYTLNLELRLKNGKYVEFNTDITDQLAKQPRGGVITVSGIRVEDEQAQCEAGFHVDITDWGERVDVELPVTPGK